MPLKKWSYTTIAYWCRNSYAANINGCFNEYSIIRIVHEALCLIPIKHVFICDIKIYQYKRTIIPILSWQCNSRRIHLSDTRIFFISIGLLSFMLDKGIIPPVIRVTSLNVFVFVNPKIFKLSNWILESVVWKVLFF